MAVETAPYYFQASGAYQGGPIPHGFASGCAVRVRAGVLPGDMCNSDGAGYRHPDQAYRHFSLASVFDTVTSTHLRAGITSALPEPDDADTREVWVRMKLRPLDIESTCLWCVLYMRVWRAGEA